MCVPAVRAGVVSAAPPLTSGSVPRGVVPSKNVTDPVGVFVPLLAASCFAIGRLAYGPTAGLLAGLFALGTPMLVSQMHMFMIDPAEAAMVAAGVWAILASRREHCSRSSSRNSLI